MIFSMVLRIRDKIFKKLILDSQKHLKMSSCEMKMDKQITISDKSDSQ